MNRKTLMNGPSRVMLVAAVAALGLAACNKGGAGSGAPALADASQAPSPLAAVQLSNVSQPMTAAPSADQLPPAPRARVARLAQPRQGYAFADQGYAMNRAFGDAPPDYAVNYNGVRPWVWRSDDNAMRVAEPTPDGERYYYYEPGSDYPYLVRDRGYSYGYQGGQLVVVYDSRGRAMDPQFVEQRADIAGRYLARAREIYDAARRQQRQAVAEANWRARRNAMAADRHQWAQAATTDPDWRDYHAEHDQQDQARWDQERFRREAEAARIAQAENDREAAQRYWQAAQQTQAYQHRDLGGGPGQPGRGPDQQAQGPGRPDQARGPDQGRGPGQGAGFVPQQGAGAPANSGAFVGQGGQRWPGGPGATPGQQRAPNAGLAAQQRAAADAARAQANAQRAQALAAQQAQAKTQAQAQAQGQAQAAAQANADRQARQQAQVNAARQAQLQSQAQAQAAREAQMRAHDQQVAAQAQAAAARQADARVREQALIQQRAQAKALHTQDAARQAMLKARQDQAAQLQAQAAARAAVERQGAQQHAAAAQAEAARAAVARAQAAKAAQMAEAARANAVAAKPKPKPKPEGDHPKPGLTPQQ